MKSLRSSTWWSPPSIPTCNLDRAAMTDRILAAIENPYTQIIAHPTGRLVLRREAFDYDMEKILDAAKKNGVAVECNAYPDRLDLKDVHLRMAKRARHESRNLHRRSQHNSLSIHEIRRNHRPSRLAGKERRHQHASAQLNS